MFENHPKGLIPAALSNMGERFGYYIMNAVLVLFLCSKFGLSGAESALIYSCFYAGIYVLSLVGGLIADRLHNYKGTIITGLVIMASGYGLLSIPILSTENNTDWLLPLTCFALLLIAFGNGLFKGNLQAIVGQMYDNATDEKIRDNRERGYQIFYVFINIGGLIAPFVAPLLRGWWLGKNALTYNADLPDLCHRYLKYGETMVGGADTQEIIAKGPQMFDNLGTLVHEVSTAGGAAISNLGDFCAKYLDIFNTGVHFSFIASVLAMAISLCIFIASKKMFPNPLKKIAKVEHYSLEERKIMADEIRKRIYALFAVLGIVIFFWYSFHQNGASLSLFAKNFVKTKSVPPEVWQAINPFYVVFLSPLVMFLFAWLKKRGKKVSTPKKIGIGMGIAGLAFLFLGIVSYANGYPSANEFAGLDVGVRDGLKLGPWVLFVLYFFLTVAELFISPLGLAYVSKIAPKNLQGLCQGLWLSATAVGNAVLFTGTMMYERIPIWKCWTVFVVLCAISMIVMLAMVRWLEKIVPDEK